MCVINTEMLINASVDAHININVELFYFKSFFFNFNFKFYLCFYLLYLMNIFIIFIIILDILKHQCVCYINKLVLTKACLPLKGIFPGFDLQNK